MTDIIETVARVLADAALLQPEAFDADARRILRAIGNAGFAVVPVEPTEAMTKAGESAAWDRANSMPAVRAIPAAWAAMVEAGRVKG